MSTTCPIKAIPPLCSGALATSVTSGGQWSLSEDVITYDPSAAVYGIGKLATQIPSFNPSWDALAIYGFDSTTATTSSWSALEYHISGGQVIGTPVATSGGACATDSYNTSDEIYTLVSWEDLASNGWTGAGGYCIVTQEPGITSSGYVPPGGAIASPPAAVNVNTLKAAISVPATPPTPGGGGGGCTVFIGVVTAAPTGGFGTGAVQSAMFSADGSYLTSGADIAVVFPYIN